MTRVAAVMAALGGATAIALGLAAVALAGGDAVKLRRVSNDPYRNRGSYHATEVEPDTFAFGKTFVATFQAGRSFAGGASNIGWATSSDGGKSWRHGFVPGTTEFSTPKATFNTRATRRWPTTRRTRCG